MAKLVLLRHFKSQWNLEDRFAGWTDGPLCKEGREQVSVLVQEIPLNEIDEVFTSPLFRNMDTVSRIFEYSPKYPFFIHLDGGRMQKWGNYRDLSQYDLPTYVSEKLNERYYGKLQGLRKQETIKKYGEARVNAWRREYRVSPPGGESMADTVKRAVPFYKKFIEKDLKLGKNILVVASHNSLRGLVKYIEKISDKDIAGFEIPFGGWLEYEYQGELYKKLDR